MLPTIDISDPLLRLPDVQKILPLSAARIYKLIAAGRLARPIAVGPNSVAWRTSDIHSYLRQVAAERALKAAGASRRRGPSPNVAGAHVAAIPT